MIVIGKRKRDLNDYGGSWKSYGLNYSFGNRSHLTREISTEMSGPLAKMEAVFFGTIKIWTHGTGSGPWVMADLEKRPVWLLSQSEWKHMFQRPNHHRQLHHGHGEGSFGRYIRVEGGKCAIRRSDNGL